MNKLHYFFGPLVLTLIGYFYHPKCISGLCLFSGHGFPLGYYENGTFRFEAFVADFIVAVVLYFILATLFRVFKNWE